MHHRILCIILYVNILNNKTLVGSSVLHVSFSVIHNERIIANNEPGKVERVVTIHSKEQFQNLFEMVGGDWQNKQWPFDYNLTGYLSVDFMSLHLSCQISDSDRCCCHLKSNMSYSSLSTYPCYTYIHLYNLQIFIGNNFAFWVCTVGSHWFRLLQTELIKVFSSVWNPFSSCNMLWNVCQTLHLSKLCIPNFIWNYMWTLLPDLSHDSHCFATYRSPEIIHNLITYVKCIHNTTHI